MKFLLAFILLIPLSLYSQTGVVSLGTASFGYEYTVDGEVITPTDTMSYTMFVEDVCAYAATHFNGIISLDKANIFITHGDKYWVNGQPFDKLWPAVIYLKGLLHTIKLQQ